MGLGRDCWLVWWHAQTTLADNQWSLFGVTGGSAPLQLFGRGPLADVGVSALRFCDGAEPLHGLVTVEGCGGEWGMCQRPLHESATTECNTRFRP